MKMALEIVGMDCKMWGGTGNCSNALENSGNHSNGLEDVEIA